MDKKKTSHVKSRKTSRQSQASRKSGKEKSTKKITGKQQSKASSKKLSKKASKQARQSSTEKEPVKARKSAAKVGPVKGRKSAAKASKRAVKARKHAVTVSKKAVKGKKSAAKAGKLPAKGKKLSAKALEALRRSEANAKRRALYAEKKAAEAKEEAAKAKKRASKSSKQAVKAEKQTVKAEKKRKTTKADVSRLLDKVRQLEDEKAALIEAAKKPKKPKRPPAEARLKLKPPKPRPVSRVFVRGLADTRGYSEGKEPEEKRTRVGGKGNKHSFNYTGVFDAVFKAKTRRIPMASDEVPIYRYGITVRVADIQNVSAAIQDMTEFLNASMPGGFSAHIVREDDSSISVSVNLGDYENESNSLSALRQIKKHSNLIASVVDRARSYSEDSDDFEWYPHWDWNAEFDEITVSP
jgi:hypothetical protein